MNLGLVVFQTATHLSDHHGWKQQTLLTQLLVDLRRMDPLLEQHHIKELTPLLQLEDWIRQGAQILEFVAAALEPTTASLLHTWIRQKRRDCESRL